MNKFCNFVILSNHIINDCSNVLKYVSFILTVQIEEFVRFVIEYRNHHHNVYFQHKKGCSETVLAETVRSENPSTVLDRVVC